ncbi:GntP family permease [Fervidobacterium gondwanense]|uniref:Predicted D-glycerate permease n=1 Tax=Fervidobacterium gondwanense DSM 13020 TaxID=1121883 RepID=A0A1M7T717_FERGO|nr:GntP family permease [Fervidobacterium gondwanense]SHN66516.1 predicted D-glycerate permease [Fervidobacterium gondwanense DSM 13020]
MSIWLPILLLLSIVFIVYSTVRWKLHPFLALIFAAFLYGLLAKMNLGDIVKSITEGFGDTVSSIGIVIVAGTIIGIFLEKSGGAFTMAESVLKVTGRKNVPLAMSLIGYIVSIPVFCDSGFVILTPLNKALTKRANLSLATTGIALSLGLYATHTMVPPTPGPVAAAGNLGADLGLTILMGMIVAVPAIIVGWLFATKYASKIQIDPEPELTEKEIEQKMKEAPKSTMAFLPIVLPIILILLKSVSDFPTNPFGTGGFKNFIGFIGHPVTALMIGVLISFLLPKKLTKDMISMGGWVGQAVTQAGVIILITAAGGAFGKVLQNSGVANLIGESLSKANLGMWLPFIISAAIKTAQGSSTVALITTSALLAPLMEPLGLVSPIAKALTVVAIGAGSMVVSHANDSYFWVVSQLSKMDVKTGYKLQTFGTLLEGLTAAVTVWIISLFVI